MTQSLRPAAYRDDTRAPDCARGAGGILAVCRSRNGSTSRLDGGGQQDIIVAQQEEEFAGARGAERKSKLPTRPRRCFCSTRDQAGIANLPDARNGVIRRCVVRYNHLNIRIGLGECAADGSKSQAAAIDGRNSDGNSPGDRHDGLVTNLPSRRCLQKRVDRVTIANGGACDGRK